MELLIKTLTIIGLITTIFGGGIGVYILITAFKGVCNGYNKVEKKINQLKELQDNLKKRRN